MSTQSDKVQLQNNKSMDFSSFKFFLFFFWEGIQNLLMSKSCSYYLSSNNSL